MIGNNFWIWLVVGLIPYYINKQQLRDEWILQVRALCWSLEIQHSLRGRNQWTLRVPLVERLRSGLWATIMHLRGEDSPKE